MGRGHWAVPRPRVSPARSSALCCATSTAPAIILIGEMRDRETLETAISAAETGHLVLSTMHPPTVAQSLTRVCEFFPAEEQIQARGAIAGSSRGFVCQKLVPKIDGYGRLPVIEILTVDATVKTLIVEVQFEKIQGLLAGSNDSASGSFNKDRYRLWEAGGIGKADALRYSPNPCALEMNFKGIFIKSGCGWRDQGHCSVWCQRMGGGNPWGGSARAALRRSYRLGVWQTGRRRKVFQAAETLLGLGFREGGRLSREFLSWHWHFYLRDRAPKRLVWANRCLLSRLPRGRFTRKPAVCLVGIWPR